MNLLSKIVKGRIGRAQRVVVYAPEGFGKSTLASQFPNPLSLDVENSTAQLDVARLGRDEMPDLKTFEEVLGEIVKTKPCATLNVDTFDRIEEMAAIELCEQHKVGNIEEVAGGFGKGYNYLTARLTVTMSKFDALIAAGINVVLLAHSSIVRFDPPDGAGAFDRYELKLYKDRKGGKGTASLIKEWADMVIFGNYRTQISEKGKGDNVKYKGVGGKERIMYCNRCAAWDAKNRHGMADVEKWDIATIEKAFLAVGAPWGGTNLKPGGEPSQNEETPRAAQPPASTPADEIPMDHEGDARRIEDEKEIEELGRVVAEHTELINEYLRKNNRIKLNDDWRGVGADYRSRILKNPAGFLKVATNGKAVTA